MKANDSLSIPGDEPGYAPRSCSLSDTDRLVWLRRNMSGVEMRRIGICMDNTGDTEEFRKRIDEFIIANMELPITEADARLLCEKHQQANAQADAPEKAQEETV